MTATTRGSPMGSSENQGQSQPPDGQSQPPDGQSQATDGQSQAPLPQNQVSMFFCTICDECGETVYVK